MPSHSTTGATVKIYFCDICNQSIPIKDIDDGVAVPVRGKLICSACSIAAATGGTVPATTTPAAPAGAAAAAAQPVRAPGSGFANIFFVLVAAGLGFGGAWLLLKEESRKVDGKFAVASGELTSLRQDFDRKLAGLRGDISEVQKNVDSLRAEIENSMKVGEARERKIAADVESRFESVKSYITENEKIKDRVQDLELRSTANSDVLSGLQKDIVSVRASILELNSTVIKALSNPQLAKPADPTAQAPDAPKGGNEGSLPLQALPNDLAEIAKKLKSADPSIRFDGVEQLGRSRDGRVVGYLVPMLQDKDDFVRRQAAEVLGDLGNLAKAAPPFLIEALGDEVAYVRESVIYALRKITTQNIKFDPTAKTEDRARQQKLWRSWWEQNREKFVGNG
jgi:hypothetical protein